MDAKAITMSASRILTEYEGHLYNVQLSAWPSLAIFRTVAVTHVHSFLYGLSSTLLCTDSFLVAGKRLH